MTTYVPSKYYDVTGTTTTKHIFAGDLLLATVQNGGSSGGTSTTTTATIYDDATTWNDWSWDTTVNLNETTTVYSGTKSLKATYTAAWGGLYLQNSAGPSTSGATHLHFAVRSSTADPDVEIDAYGPGDTLRGYVMLDTYIPSMAANTWYVVDIPLTALGAVNTTLTGFSALRGTTGVLYFDEIKLIAAGQGGGGSASTTVRYVHTDHLTGANTITSQTGQIIETLDYYPYGQIRVNDKTTTYDERRKYAGTEYDTLSGLNYMQARYYDSNTAHFISQDPVFWEVGVTKDGKAVLTNPQALNSYSYAGGNPIVNKDATGRLFGVDDAAVAVIGYSLWAYSVASLGVDLYDAKTTFVDYPEQFSSEEKSQVAGKLILDGVLGAAARVARGVEQITINVGTTFLDIMDYYFADQLYKDMNDKKKNEPSDDKGQKTSSSQRTSNSQANSTKTGSYLTNASGSRVNGTNGGGSNQTFSSTYSQFTNGLRSFTASLSSFVAGLSSAGGKNTSNKK